MMQSTSRNTSSRRPRGGRGGRPSTARPEAPVENYQPARRTRLHDDDIWDLLDENVQRVALEQDLIEEGERFTLTRDQGLAIKAVNNYLDDHKERVLLVAPTGAGKTEVMLRCGLASHLHTRRTTIIIVPTRDLSRQHLQYMTDRLAGTGVEVCELHGGVPPSKRRRDMDAVRSGDMGFAVGSAMLMHNERYRALLSDAGLVIIDDIHAFDERQDLSYLRRIKTPMLYATATPAAVANFLKREGAWDTRFEMKSMPFDSPPTVVHRLEAGFGENVFSQLDRALPYFQKHVDARSRVYVISRTRAKVPTLTLYLEDKLGIHVSMLHGEMADTKEHSQRQRGPKSVWAKGPETRTEMMRTFKHHVPSVMVATNLVGSGLDIPMADLIVITDSDHFSEAEMEQLIGRVGRRSRTSDAVLLTGTVVSREPAANIRGRSVVKNGRVVMTFGLSRGKGRRR